MMTPSYHTWIDLARMVLYPSEIEENLIQKTFNFFCYTNVFEILQNLARIEARDNTTVALLLKQSNDNFFKSIFQFILSN